MHIPIVCHDSSENEAEGYRTAIDRVNIGRRIPVKRFSPWDMRDLRF